MKNTMKILLGLALAVVGYNAQAVVISTPIDYTTNNLVGTAAPGVGASSIAEEAVWAQDILDLAAGTTSGIYRTHDTDEYSGAIDSTGSFQSSVTGDNSIEAGWEYVLGKYDGPNGGYILFFLGGEASTIPEFSDAIWTNPQDQGYQLSHYTVFNSTTVPEPGMVALLSIGLLGMVAARRRMKL